MTIPVALQLYSVRDALARDFGGVMKKIAKMGYVGVEPILDLPGTTIPEAAKLFRELGLEVPSAHAPLPNAENKNKILDYMAALGCKRFFPSTDRTSFGTIDAVKRVCDLFNEAQVIAAENGLSLGIHNHWWEFQKVNGRYAYHVIMEHLAPAVLFQLDTYWVQAAGLDPAQVVEELGVRSPSLHIKDGPAVKDAPMVAVGDGVLDIPRIIQAANGSAEWLVVELDQCATDMMEAVEKSYRYLVKEGLACGSKG